MLRGIRNIESIKHQVLKRRWEIQARGFSVIAKNINGGVLMDAIKNLLTRLFLTVQSEKGQTVIEYILVIVLIALILVIAFTQGGVEQGVRDASTNIAEKITNTP